MLSTLIIGLCIGINVRTVYASNSLASTEATIDNNSHCPASSRLVDVQDDLTKIATTCLGPQDLESLAGNTFRYHLVGSFMSSLIEVSVATIGLRELRTTLKLPPLPTWKRMNWTRPNEDELRSATILEYYDLREPRSGLRSLDSRYFYERNVDTAITHLNKRLPSVLTIFKRTFQAICPSPPKNLDKETIDRMIDVFHETSAKIRRATSEMLTNYDCWGDYDP